MSPASLPTTLAEWAEALGGRLSSSASAGRQPAGLADDSRRVEPGDLFFARKGSGADGRRFAQAAFEAVDRDLVDAARTLGASEARAFATVAIPTAGSGIGGGVALAWGRALGEFGATLMFAGSFQGITQTVPLAIFATFSRDFTGALRRRSGR